METRPPCRCRRHVRRYGTGRATGQSAWASSWAIGRNCIPLREDVLNTAFGRFADTFLNPSDAAVQADHKRMAVIGFSDAAQLLQSPTNSKVAVKAAPTSFPEASRVNTMFAVAIPQIKTLVGAQGNGAPGAAHKALLLISDGLGWKRIGGTAAERTPIDPALCDSIKSQDIAIAVLDVQYQDATGEHWFDLNVSPMYPAISPALQACASSGLYFQASDSDAQTLGDAFSRVADAMTSKLALTQ
jgi:hypothetical protein